MRGVAICLLLALALWVSGCSSSTTPNAQNEASGVWEASLTGGSGTSSGFSFVVQFSVSANGTLSTTDFQFLNDVSGGCFAVDGETPSGSLTGLTYNSADQLTGGNLSFTVTGNGNTLTLTSTSISGTLNGNTITGGTIAGTWTLQGSGSGCSSTNGQFTMTQSSTTT